MSRPQKLLAEVDKVVLNCFEKPINEKLAKMTVSIDSTLLSHYELERKQITVKFRSKKLKYLLRLAILSHYIEDDGLAFYLKDALLSLPDIPEYSIVKFITKRKGNLELYLIGLSESRSSRFIFGNLLNVKDLQEALEQFFVSKTTDLSTPAQKRLIGVGYRDKGHLPQFHQWYPKHDITLNEQQNKIELNRQAAHDLEDLISGLLL